MSWLTELFCSGHETANAIAVLALVAVLGLAIVEIRLGTVKLGIAGPLFVGNALGHFSFELDMTMLAFARDFGLLVFAYAVGITATQEDHARLSAQTETSEASRSTQPATIIVVKARKPQEIDRERRRRGVLDVSG